MEPSSEQFGLLELVARFSAHKRYGGVMPMRLVAHKDALIEALISNRLLDRRSVRGASGCHIDGLCLTDFGRRLLRTS